MKRSAGRCGLQTNPFLRPPVEHYSTLLRGQRTSCCSAGGLLITPIRGSKARSGRCCWWAGVVFTYVVLLQFYSGGRVVHCCFRVDNSTLPTGHDNNRLPLLFAPPHCGDELVLSVIERSCKHYPALYELTGCFHLPVKCGIAHNPCSIPHLPDELI
jgi:hypothetical protein